MFASISPRCIALLACLLFAATARADAGAEHSPYVSATGIVDSNDNSTADIEFGLPLGAHAWVSAGAGRDDSSRDSNDLNADVLRGAFGVGSEHLELTTGYVRRKDDGFKQGDWSVALDWRGTSGGVGLDYFNRKSDAETVTSIARRRLAPRSVRITESLDGDGFGVHGDIDVADNVNLFASAMKYDYDDVDTNHPLLSRLLFLGGSGVTREEAFLDNAYGFGATYRFSAVSLTAQYLRDEALETHDVTDTGELSLLVLLGDHWSLTPSIGYSDGEVDGDVTYGGVSISYYW